MIGRAGLKFRGRDADLVFMMEGSPDEDGKACAAGWGVFINFL
jgi:hypothetical protein